jgi:nitroreductase
MISLERKIAVASHSIEKGLSREDFRYGFGSNALKLLLTSMLRYERYGFPLTRDKYETAIAVIQAYINRHSNMSLDVDYLKQFLETRRVDGSHLGGSVDCYSSQILTYKDSNFMLLSSNRVSVRNFSIIPVKSQTIYEAIEIAKKTPSACNRQPWKVRIIRDEKLLKDLLSLQAGLNGDARNLKVLLVITTMFNYSSFPKERYQGYTDTGMFCMSLIYALTSLGCATCPLNSNFNFKKDKIIRKMLKIGVDEGLVMFLAIGNYPETFKVPISQRDKISSKILEY